MPIHKEKRALFLDRDGIINIDHGYVYKVEDFKFVEGIFELVRLFTDAGYLIFVVTNQSGIGRGYYTEKDFTILTELMKEKFLKNNIKIEEVYYCPHAPEVGCICRKPQTGMINKALENYDIDLYQSWMIGDKQSDIALATNAGIGKSIYIGNKNIPNTTHTFFSINEAKSYFQDNKGKIQNRSSKGKC